MEITGVDVVGERIPFADAFPVSYGTHSDTDHLFVRLRTDGDLVGYGEGTALAWFTGEVTEGMAGVVERHVAPLLTGESLDDAATAFDAFRREYPGAPGAKAAVDLALFDLRAKRAGVPVHELLGPQARESVPVTWVLPALSPEEVATKAGEKADAGFRSFKVKADGDVEGDAARVNAVLGAIPDDAVLRVDANTGWERFGRARRAVERFDDPDRIEYVEQPVATNRSPDMGRLWEATDVPVFADEAANTPEDVAAFGREGTVAGCHLKLAKSGSLSRLKEIQGVAARNGMTVTVVSAFGTSLEAAANVHLGATTPNLSAGCELCTGLLETDLGDPAFPLSPTVDVSRAPGLGVSLPDALFD
jgi:L-alanine-DL-glutamate epimerase-like enolase superfamily enzyme